MRLPVFTLPFRAVLMRELRTLLRTQKGFGLAMGVIATIALLFLISWSQMGSGSLLNDRAKIGQTLFHSLGSLQIFISSLLAATLGAGSFTGERQRRTLDLLITAGLSPRTLTLAKWGAAALFLLLIFVASLPLYALVLQLGGVGPDDWIVMAWGGLISIGTAAIYGLAFSSFSTSTLRAVLGMLGFSLVIVFISMFMLTALITLFMSLLGGFNSSLGATAGFTLHMGLIAWLSYLKCLSRLRSVESERELMPGEAAITEATPPLYEDKMRIALPYRDDRSAIYQQEQRYHG